MEKKTDDTLSKMSLRDLISSRSGKPSVYDAEMTRIISLGLNFKPEPHEISWLNETRVQADSLDAGWKFLDGQDNAVLQYRKYNGAFCVVVVGGGKTLAIQTIASMGFEKGLQRILVLVPANTYHQFTNRDMQFARRHFVLTSPFYFLGSKTAKKRQALANSGRPGVYVLPYSLLQARDGRELIRAVNPELIVADEIQYLKNKRSARTQRLFDFINRHNPEFVGLTGTITDKSVKDYHHLAIAALGELSPLPIPYMQAMEWAGAIDANVEEITYSTEEALQPLKDWAREHFPKEIIRPGIFGFRDAYKLRLKSCPGVVHKNSDELGIPLHIRNFSLTSKPGPDLLNLISEVEEDEITPNGDPIEYAIHKNKWLGELNSGFWHKLTFPSPEKFAAQKDIPLEEATELVEAAKFHHEIHNEYLLLLRRFLRDNRRPGMDTPFLVGQHIYRHEGTGLPRDLVAGWKAAKSLEVPGMPERESEPIIVDRFRAETIADWVESQHRAPGLLLFYYHKAYGQMVYEALQARGLDPLFCPAGADGNRTIAEVGSALRPTVASLTGHGTGKNLQHYKQIMYTQPVRSATKAEQSIGRIHRTGQEAEEIFVWNSLTTDYDTLTWAACLNDALYVQQSTGVYQKVIYANYDPLPKTCPVGFLEERGFKPHSLTAADAAKLKDIFSDG